LNGPHGISATQQLMWLAAICTWSGTGQIVACVSANSCHHPLHAWAAFSHPLFDDQLVEWISSTLLISNSPFDSQRYLSDHTHTSANALQTFPASQEPVIL
jgi:hypothetical protein